MRRFVYLVVSLIAAFPATSLANPCTNGSFEELESGGFPVDWAPVGGLVEVVSDAHSGERAIRLFRTKETTHTETGINRSYRPGTPDGGAMIAPRRGGAEFWYKALSASGADLCVFAIPMGEDGVENTKSPRSRFVVPAEHIGDGQWHRGRLKYDFTDDEQARWVQFSPRIVGTGGEILLDDFQYLEQVGPILRVGTIRIDENSDLPGERCSIRARIENAGDQVAESVTISLQTVDGLGLKTSPEEILLNDLAPGRAVRAEWMLVGARTKPGTLTIKAHGDESTATASLALATSLEIRSFGPQQPVAGADKPTLVECEVENTGQLTIADLSGEFNLAGQTASESISKLAPGQRAVLTAKFLPESQNPSAAVSVRIIADGIENPLTATSRMVIGSPLDLASTRGGLAAVSNSRYALLSNRYVRLGFRKNAFGFGPGELSVARGGKWETVAWLPRLSRLVYRNQAGKRVVQDMTSQDPPELVGSDPKSLRFRWQLKDDDGVTWQATIVFELADWSKEIKTRYELSCDKAAELLVFDGPMLCAVRRDEAIFPGLEWLVAGELSSDSLDIEADHPHRIRHVVDPNMITVPAVGFHSDFGTVGMFWDLHQKWDGKRDRPSAVFASPDRFENQRSHLIGIFAPSVPEFVDANQREATRPFTMRANRRVTLSATLFVDVDADDPLVAIDRWFETYGLPPLPPLPHETYKQEIEFSMQAYLRSLWDAESKQWWVTKGSPAMSRKGRPRDYVADLMLGALITDDPTLRRQCLARAEQIRPLLGGEARLDAQRFPGRADLAFANPEAVASLLASRNVDGSWAFDADQQPQSGPFVGLDYAELGPDKAVESGTCAQKAHAVLRYARISGDREAYEQMLPTLTLLESFRVPRAAQVWEVPVHSPDLLASADAVDAFIEAYRFSGQSRWLGDAVDWAHRGLPFLYLWDDPDKPYLQGASIPVFGATWHRHSWFGTPVQWNGLRYAVAILKLSEYDDSYPWRGIAERIIRSAIHQQALDGEDVALWPDSISAIDGEKSAWVFAPHQILQAILKLTGRDPEPATVIVGPRDRPIHVTTAGKIISAGHHGTVFSMEVEFPPGEEGIVLISNVSRPSEVYMDRSALRERIDVEQWNDPGWRYDGGNAYLAVRVNKDGRSQVRADGVVYREIRRLPWRAESIAFDFENSLDGWLPSHDISEMIPRQGTVFGRISGPDPYLIRRELDVDANDALFVNLRMRTTAGGGGQLFWATKESPLIAEEQSLRFQTIPDGRMHDYRLELRKHPAWKGQTITQLRLDPANGTRSGEFNIEYLRAETPAPEPKQE